MKHFLPSVIFKILFLLIIFLFNINSPFLISQTKINFFPLNLGNQYLIRDSSRNGPPLTIQPIIDKRITITDTMEFQGKTLYNYNYNYYYYNLEEQKFYILKNNALVLSIDFSSPATDSGYVNFYGLSHTCKLSGVYKSYYAGAIRNCYSVNYDYQTGSNQYISRDFGSYVFCENIGLIFLNSYEVTDWYTPPSNAYYESKDSTVSAIVNNITYKPIAPPVFYLSDSLRDRRIDEFPFYLKSYFSLQYPEMITSVFVDVKGYRDNVLIYYNRDDFNRAVGLAKIENTSSVLQPGDSLTISCILTYNIFKEDTIRIPETGTLSFKVLPPALSVKDKESIPGKFDISGYPNPFNPSTKIRYSIPDQSYIDLEIFSPLGEKIIVLESGLRTPGIHETNWKAGLTPSGIYYVRLVSKSLVSGKLFAKTIKMVYLK